MLKMTAAELPCTKLGPLHVEDSCGLVYLRGPWRWYQDLSWCMGELDGAHSLWWDAMVTLNAGDKDLVLPQLNVLDIVDSLWKTLPFKRSGWGGWGGSKGSRRGEGRYNCDWNAK